MTTHARAAALIGVTEAELERLAQAGHVQRNDKNDYSVQVLVPEYCEYLRRIIESQDLQPKQVDIAAHLDISDRRVRELATEWGIDSKSITLSEWRVRYIRHLREQAAGRAGSGGELDLVQERAALARSQREAQDLKNAIARGEYAPIGVLTDVLSAASSAIVDRMDQIEGQLRKACPDLPESARQTIMRVLADARNEWIRSTTKLVSDKIESIAADDGDEDEPDDLQVEESAA